MNVAASNGDAHEKRTIRGPGVVGTPECNIVLKFEYAERVANIDFIAAANPAVMLRLLKIIADQDEALRVCRDNPRAEDEERIGELEVQIAAVKALRDEWRNEGPDCTHVLCASEHNSGCGASSCFAKDIDEKVFGIEYD